MMWGGLESMSILAPTWINTNTRMRGMALGKGLLETGTFLYPICAFPQVKKSLHNKKVCDSKCLLITREVLCISAFSFCLWHWIY